MRERFLLWLREFVDPKANKSHSDVVWVPVKVLKKAAEEEVPKFMFLPRKSFLSFFRDG